MERIIKFRGKDSKVGVDQHWRYGYYAYVKGEHFIISADGNAWSVNPETIGQFSGKWDNHNIEIYDTDILKFNHGGFNAYGELKFIRNGFWVTGVNTNDKFLPTNCIVIGNSIDDPNLLNEKS